MPGQTPQQKLDAAIDALEEATNEIKRLILWKCAYLAGLIAAVVSGFPLMPSNLDPDTSDLGDFDGWIADMAEALA